MEEDKLKFTEEDIDAVNWIFHKQYLLEILNGEVTVEEVRENLRSLIGSKYDERTK